ncbi:DUF7311 family protein [Halosegnis marinus]|uniref:DUF7311 domain-containing protein n=1 Tax=Halosegnis marinus TaxID=3034023 RepID=A0ABD5ZQH5_9EURY|nr:hypothetical protein [Halosegnis sp. DT85]
MVVRVVLAVLLAAALVGYALPAVEDARAGRADGLARDELTDLRERVARFAERNDPAPPGTAGASLVVVVRVPRETDLGMGVGPRGESLAWERDGRNRVETDLSFDGPLWLREPGRHRLRLSLVARDGEDLLLVRRFKSGNGTTTPSVRTPLDRRLPV